MKKLLLYHKIVYVMGYLNTLVGKFIFLCKEKKVYNLLTIQEILVNRSDRIGDAILTKPFLVLFIEYARQCGYTGTWTVLASPINASVFADLPVNIVITNQTIANPTGNIFVILLYKLQQGIASLIEWMKINKNKSHKHILIIDLVGWRDISLLLSYYREGYRDIVGGNIALGSILLSNRITTPFTTFQGKRNFLEPCIDLLTFSFIQTSGFRQFVYNNMHAFYPIMQSKKNFGLVKNILVYVGCKPERNLSLQTWVDILHELAKQDTIIITVIDDQTNLIYKGLKNIINNDCIHLKENTMTLDAFHSFAKGFDRIIGLDGGGMNIIRHLTNSTTIFVLADQYVWSGFSGPYQRTQKKISKELFLSSVRIPVGGFELCITNIASYTHGVLQHTNILPAIRYLMSDFILPRSSGK